MKPRHTLLIAIALTALGLLCLSSCNLYNAVARPLGLPEEGPDALRSPASDTNIYDVMVNDRLVDYAEQRRAGQ